MATTAAVHHHPALISDASLQPALPELNTDSYNFLMTQLHDVGGASGIIDDVANASCVAEADYTRLLDVESIDDSGASPISSPTTDSAYSSPVRMFYTNTHSTIIPFCYIIFPFSYINFPFFYVIFVTN